MTKLITPSRFIIFTLLSFSVTCFQALALEQQLLLGALKHPQVDKYKQILIKAYADIGVELKFVTLTNERQLIAANQGVIDGIAIGISNAADHYQNLIKVHPKLASGSTYLLCNPDVPCDKEIFKKEGTVILGNNQNYQFLQSFFGDELKAEMLEMERVGAIYDLLVSKRSSYALYQLDQFELPADIKLNLNYIKLVDVDAFHFLNKKFEHLVPKLTPSYEKQLNRFYGKD